jgi:hypothetical protein
LPDFSGAFQDEKQARLSGWSSLACKLSLENVLPALDFEIRQIEPYL